MLYQEQSNGPGTVPGTLKSHSANRIVQEAV
jgi:hypothetical protein